MSGASNRLLCLMGSGETSPTMVSVHQDLMTRAQSPPHRALLLDTPYGFEENAAGITAKAQDYFAGNVGHPITTISVPDFRLADGLLVAQLTNGLRESRYIFAGPGSPSYALNQWQPSPVPGLLSQRLSDGGCVTFASAAATTLGRLALPVYEIYKVGARPHWLEGLGILDGLGLPMAVIPHYDNAQGGTHDTRYCFMGERRLLDLEDQLDPGVGLLGIAEHTAAILDLDADTLTVRGRGFAVLRRQGLETRFEPGETVPLDRLRSGSTGGTRAAAHRADPGPSHPDSGGSLSERFDTALTEGDTTAALELLLEMEAGLAEHSATAVTDERRAEFRGMLVRLGEAAADGVRDPAAVVGPFVELALRLRGEARGDKRFASADAIRDALTELGVEIHDAADGSSWELKPRQPGSA